MEKNLLATRDELASERSKNAGLKDHIVRITGQRDDAVARLSGTQPMSYADYTNGLVSPPRHTQQRFDLGRAVHEFGRAPASPTKLASMRKHAELSDALITPMERNTFEPIDMVMQSPARSVRRDYPPSSPRIWSDDGSTIIDCDFTDFRSRSRRLNTLRKCPTINVPEESIAYPVCNASEDLEAKLKALAKSHIFIPPYFFSESDVEFANPTRQHGYIVRPPLVLEEEHNRWSPYTLDTLEPDFLSIFELFVGSSKGWFYRGTYRRADQGGLDWGNLTMGEYLDPNSTVLARSRSFASHPKRPQYPTPFASGDVLAQCIGLQCIGFNASLHHALDHLVLDHRGRSAMATPMSDFTAVAGTSNPPTWAATPPPDRPKSGWDPISPEFGWHGGAKSLIKRFSNTWSGHKRIRSLDVGHGDDDTQTVGKKVKLGRSGSLLRFPGI